MQSCLRNDTRQVYPVFRQIHSQDVVVTEIENLLLKEEAEYLTSMAQTIGMHPSTVAAKDGQTTIDPRRTSTSAYIPKSKDKVVKCIEDRLATVAAIPVENLEPLQITDYKHKQEFRPHHDYINNPNSSERTKTLFAYLKSDHCETKKCGGSTVFPNLRTENDQPLRIFPKVGNAVMWSNTTDNGSVNPASLHGGELLTCESAHKIGLNAWFRDRAWE